MLAKKTLSQNHERRGGGKGGGGDGGGRGGGGGDNVMKFMCCESITEGYVGELMGTRRLGEVNGLER